MFWNKKKTGDSATVDQQSAKQKKATPKDLMVQQLEAIEADEELTYKLGEIYVKPYITVARNQGYPEKGKKYVVYQEGKAVNGSPSGNRGRFWETNNPGEIAAWMLEREGKLYVH